MLDDLQNGDILEVQYLFSSHGSQYQDRQEELEVLGKAEDGCYVLSNHDHIFEEEGQWWLDDMEVVPVKVKRIGQKRNA